jgi:hypothetical protein
MNPLLPGGDGGFRYDRGMKQACLTLVMLLASGAVPAQQTYLNCLALFTHSLDPNGRMVSEGLATDDEQTPLFRLDLRNGALFGRLPVDFAATGELLISSGAVGEPWVAWWIVREGNARRVDMLRLDPPAGRGPVYQFTLRHEGSLYTGACGDAAAAPDLPERVLEEQRNAAP